MKKRDDVIAVDLGGTNLRAALIRNNKILKFIKIRTPKGKNNLLKAICNVIKEVWGDNVNGIGIGTPGPLKNGVIINPPNIPLKNFDLKNFIRKRFNIRIEVDNDAKCAALAELVLGVKKKNFFILTLGTGIGGGVIIDGKLYNKGDLGAELGNIYLDEGKKFEDLVGGKAIKMIIREKFRREVNFIELTRMKDKKAVEITDYLTDNLAKGIGSLINVFNPEIVVLAGGMRKAGEGFLNIVRIKAKKYIFLPAKDDIVWSKLDEPGLLGAGVLMD